MMMCRITPEAYKTVLDNLAALAGGDLASWAHDLVIEMVEALEIALPTEGPIAERIAARISEVRVRT